MNSFKMHLHSKDTAFLEIFYVQESTNSTGQNKHGSETQEPGY